MSESAHFKDSELSCHCCGMNACKPELLDALEQLRFLAGCPIVVTCAYRCPPHNKAVGGAPKSEHLLGIAADVYWGKRDVQAMYDLAKRVPEFRDGGIGVYDRNFLHVDTRKGRARWAQVKGKYVGIEKLVKA